MKQQMKWTIGLFVLSIFFVQCRKSIYNNPGLNAGTEVTTTLCGLVVDENGVPIDKALVQCNGKNCMTTNKGIFILNKVTAFENKTDINISKDGFFKSHRTILVKNGQTPFTKVVMLKKDLSQLFDAGNGGTVTFGNQLSFNFPAQSLMYKSSGISYSGQAEIVVKYIDPTTNNGLLSMPGNLMGIDSNESQKVLTSYGMFVAELYDLAGNQLQIKANEKVQMSMEIPSGMRSSASPLIPLWYFDENKEIWVEEGSATRNGNRYVGDIGHFSFWNCDAPNGFIKLEMTLVDQNNFPLSGVLVFLTDLSTNSKSPGTTDSKGWVGGMVPANANLKMEIFTPDICGQVPISVTTFNTNSIDQNLGNVVVSIAGANSCRITGKLVNCNQATVNNGMVYFEELDGVVFTNQTGNFAITLPCTPPSAITLFCHDLSNNQYDSTTVTAVSGTNDFGNLNACGLYGKFFNITVKKVNSLDSFKYSYISPKDMLWCNRADNEPFVNMFLIGPIDAVAGNLMLHVYPPITLGQFNVTSALAYDFTGPENIFAEEFFDIAHTGKMTITSNSPFPGDITGYYEIIMNGLTSNQEYKVYGDFRLPKLKDF